MGLWILNSHKSQQKEHLGFLTSFLKVLRGKAKGADLESCHTSIMVPVGLCYFNRPVLPSLDSLGNGVFEVPQENC